MSQPTWLAELPELVEAFSIESPGAFTLFGSPYRTPAPEDAVPTTNSLLSAPAQTGLADALYLALHCRFAQGSDRYRDPIGARDFAESVARSSAGVGPWQPGWTVRAIEPDGRIVAEKYGVLFWLAADRFRGDGGSPAPNQRGWVRIPGKFETLSGGFHMVLGDGDDEAEIEPLVRIYWHLTAAGAARLTRTLTSRLDGAAIPFRFKTGSDPIRYHRTDAAVLYLARRRYLTALPVIAATYLEIADALRRPVSALVRPLAPGLGLAEDSDDGASFGETRCRLLALGLASPAFAAATTTEGRVAAVVAAVRLGGFDPEAIHLDRGSVDRYPGLPETQVVVSAVGLAPPEHPPNFAPASALAVAAGIANELCRTASWYQDRCTWLGMVQDGDEDDDTIELRCETVGPDLYGGGAGIALFLAEAARMGADHQAARAAMGALTQAIATRDRVPALVRASVYEGSTGLALVAARIGQLLDHPELLETAGNLADEAITAAAGADPLDVISGLAGAIPPLLELAATLERPDLAETAAEWGRRIVAAGSARRLWQPEAWPGPDPTGSDPVLTGFAHGASGIGWALHALANATGDGAFRTAADTAFQYENRWFQRGLGNWADLREWGGEGPPPCQLAWCHGAPGIGLGRLRAAQLTGDLQYFDDAATALETTLAAAADPDADIGGDWCLCHGWAGLGMFLLRAGEVLARPDARDAALALARRGAVRHGGPSARWPTGVRRGTNPSLMIGLAGIGYFYLSLADPTLRSALEPGSS